MLTWLSVAVHTSQGQKHQNSLLTIWLDKCVRGSVIVDVAVGQGGVVETADRVTAHDEPVYETHGVLHYAVANIPGAVARTSTIAPFHQCHFALYRSPCGKRIQKGN